MPGTKRGLSDGTEGVQQSKIPKITLLLSAPRPRRPLSHFTIEVRCPLKEKAKRNDWKPPATIEGMRAQFAVSVVYDNTGLTDEEELRKLGDDEVMTTMSTATQTQTKVKKSRVRSNLTLER
ncbi:hypothetical protein E2P81_ATG01415 [Venturia nashicola]|uniref:Uncharacterized protein n=1 Tax=Venturia nashicola TaxID=86259 RepID=A0A4Z1PH05_9PEZI|nr:hypothetical protein E6O75_ATG01447 [Venturia nashicola]TLD38872.1 hypothetical protein E2P81_ATG01415 [Venturia nashicola]